MRDAASPRPDETAAPGAPHSREYLTERARSFLWDPDYLRLMGARWRLAEVEEALDVGCGVGHWTFALAEALPGHTRLTGVDREAEWVAKAADGARARGLAARASFLQGEVERLPFADASFDFVTCQTLLIHVSDPAQALRELVRVLRPGGLLVAVEPANRSQIALCGSLERTPGAQADRLRFYLTCERGKIACGEGDLSIGDRLPGLLAGLGLHGVTVRQWEHAAPLFPPYDTPQQRALVDDLRSRVQRGVWAWDQETARRYFLAGGGDAVRFDPEWRAALAASAEIVQAIEARTYHAGGGAVVYVVWGRKPTGTGA